MVFRNIDSTKTRLHNLLELLLQNHYITSRPNSKWVDKALEPHSQDHSQMWMLERLTSIGSISSFAAMYIHPCENAELFFSLIVCIHVHL